MSSVGAFSAELGKVFTSDGLELSLRSVITQGFADLSYTPAVQLVRVDLDRTRGQLQDCTITIKLVC